MKNRTSTIFAGETHPVTDLNGNEFAVRVRAMPARHLGRVLQLCLDEAALLDFVCQIEAPVIEPAEGDKTPVTEFAGWQAVPSGWSDNLTDDSHELLLEAAKRLNFTRAAKWGERQIEAKQFQAPLLLKSDEALMPIVEKMAQLLTSSLPQSASPGAPSTKS